MTLWCTEYYLKIHAEGASQWKIISGSSGNLLGLSHSLGSYCDANGSSDILS